MMVRKDEWTRRRDAAWGRENEGHLNRERSRMRVGVEVELEILGDEPMGRGDMTKEEMVEASEVDVEGTTRSGFDWPGLFSFYRYARI
jgi:hypothetical protein